MCVCVCVAQIIPTKNAAYLLRTHQNYYYYVHLWPLDIAHVNERLINSNFGDINGPNEPNKHTEATITTTTPPPVKEQPDRSFFCFSFLFFSFCVFRLGQQNVWMWTHKFCYHFWSKSKFLHHCIFHRYLRYFAFFFDSNGTVAQML